MIIWRHPLSERLLFSQPASLSLSLHRGPKKDCSGLVLVTSSLQLVLPVPSEPKSTTIVQFPSDKDGKS